MTGWNRLGLAVGAVVGGNDEFGLHRIDERLHRRLHVYQVIDAAAQILQRRIGPVQIPGVKNGYVSCSMGD